MSRSRSLSCRSWRTCRSLLTTSQRSFIHRSTRLFDQVSRAVDELLKDSFLPLGEKNGSLRFLTQAAVTLQKQFDDIETVMRTYARNSATPCGRYSLRSRPPGSTVSAVSAGIRLGIGGGQSVSLEGEREPIQFHVEFAPASAYEQTRTERENDSRGKQELTSIWIVGKADPAADPLASRSSVVRSLSMPIEAIPIERHRTSCVLSRSGATKRRPALRES